MEQIMFEILGKYAPIVITVASILTILLSNLPKKYRDNEWVQYAVRLLRMISLDSKFAGYRTNKQHLGEADHGRK